MRPENITMMEANLQHLIVTSDGWATDLDWQISSSVLRIAQKTPGIEYRKLMEEARLWDTNFTHPSVTKRTVQRAMADEGYRNFRAKRRPRPIRVQ